MGHRMTQPGWVVALLAAMLSPGVAASPIEVRTQLWGFDGRVVPERFVPLSLLIVNVSDRPYAGELALTQDLGLSRVGARFVEGVYLSPGSARWVQFYPYVAAGNEQWRVSWKPGAGSEAVTQPQRGPPACVLLTDPDDPVHRPSKLKQFSAALFPPNVAATDALGTLVLDHAPNWGPPRRLALLNWLHRGGKLGIIHQPAGGFPRFDGDLALLNTTAERQRVGAGLVVRHPITHRQLTREKLVELGLAPPETEADTALTTLGLSDTMLSQLKDLTRPDHNWPALLSLGALYVVLIAPLNWLFGRRRDYRLTVLAFVFFVAAFSATFFVLGKRGYGEKATVHSMSYVRPAMPGVYDLTQWSHVFVTSSDNYKITHAGPFNLYATGLEFEKVPGDILGGTGGQFVVRMPLFSTRAFLHRGQVPGADLIARVIDFDAGDGLKKLKLETGEGFPQAPQEVWAVYREQVYALNALRGEWLTLRSRQGAPLDQFADQSGGMYGPWGRSYWDRDEDPEVARDQAFAALTRSLIGDRSGYRSTMASQAAAWAQSRAMPTDPAQRRAVLQALQQSAATADEAPQVPTADPAREDSVQIFIVAPSPPQFHISGDQFGQQHGRTVYHQTLFDPEGTDSD